MMKENLKNTSMKYKILKIIHSSYFNYWRSIDLIKFPNVIRI